MDKKKTLFDVVAEGDDKQLEQLLLEGKEERNVATQAHGNTVLHEAAWKGYSRCAKLLCNVYPKKEQTAQCKEKFSLMKTKFINQVNFGGFSALHLAAQNGHNQTMRELLYAGCNTAIHNDYGDTPLHTACRYGHASAVRILISAKCDADAFNLNHDTPLHITCAMGRRKLTKLLLESGALQFTNLQHETPRDIAMRKNLIEILDILSSFENLERKKSSPHHNKSKKHGRADKSDRRNWSPYGCHYYPDPRNFPTPKLETLPKEPLLKGEQYYLDLAGSIKKGPISIGNACYCAPFSKEIINENCHNIRKYVDKANEKLDRKVNALAMKIENQKNEKSQENHLIQSLKDENRKVNVEKWLKRGVYSRATIGKTMGTGVTENGDNKVLTKCKSLELVDDDYVNKNGTNKAKSMELMDDYVEGAQGGATATLESGFYDLNGNNQDNRGGFSEVDDDDMEGDEGDDDDAYSNSMSKKSSHSATKNSMYNESFLLNYQQHQQQFYQNTYFASNTDSLTTPSLSSNSNIELEMNRITKSLLDTAFDTKKSPDVINDHVKIKNVSKNAVTKPTIASILPPGDLYINHHFKDSPGPPKLESSSSFKLDSASPVKVNHSVKLESSSPETNEIKNSQIKYLKTQQSAKSREVELLVAKVQTIVNASNISSIQSTVNHSTNLNDDDDKKYLYSGMGRVRNPLPMNIDEIEEYTENFFEYPSQAQSQDEVDAPSLSSNNFILLDKLLKARKKFNLSYQQQQRQMLYHQDEQKEEEEVEAAIREIGNNDGANISASSLV